MSLFNSIIHWAIQSAADAGKKAALQTTQDLASQLISHLHTAAPDVAAEAEKDVSNAVLKAVAGITTRLGK